MGALIFRDAIPADIPLLLRLSHDGDARGADTPPLDPGTLTDPRYRAAFDEITANPDHRLIVATLDGNVIGTLQISLIPGLPNFGLKRGMLENVHIRADQRGTGYGKSMVEWAIEECRRAGCGKVQLTSNKLRKDAHRFYVGLGFTPTHEGFKREL